MQPRRPVVIEITDPTEGAAAVVLSAAMQLFSPADPVEVVLFVAGVEQPDEQVAALVQQLCVDGASGELPETVLLGCGEAAARDAVLRVRTGTSAADAARASALLGGLTQVLEPATDEGQLLRTEVLKRQAARDPRAAVAIDRGLRRPTVALLFQHRSYWNAVATVVEALGRDPRIELLVVALDSEADGRRASTAEFLREQGLRPVSAQHLIDSLDDVDVVLLDNPYDETRPTALSAGALAERGVRLAAVPYGYGAIGGDFMDRLLWDLPLQQLAWRSYVPAPSHKAMYDRHCRTGSAHVRVVGSAKLDRLVRPPTGLDPVRELAGDRPVVLWNPHFRLGAGGWSTFDTYFEPVLRWFMAHPDVVLLLRPHFRLFRDLAVRGGVEARVEATVRRLVAEHENLVLDESPDYVPALTVADAMMSDLSSLATEYLVTGRPLLYLHRADGPGANAVGDHFALMETARSWEDVRGWLGRVRNGRASRPDAGLVQAHLGQVDGHAGERIATALVDDLVAALVPDLPARQAIQPVRVTAAAVSEDGCRVRVEGTGVELAWASSQVTAPSVAVVDGTAVLPSYARVLGGPLLPLPSGVYRLVASRDGQPCPVALADDLRGGQTWTDGRCSVTLRVAGADALELDVAPPVPRDADRTRLIEHATYTGARTQRLEDAVVLTSYNGTAAACSPLSIDREVARQRPDLRRYWVVQDLSVAVPAGAVPLVQGSKEH